MFRRDKEEEKNLHDADMSRRIHRRVPEDKRRERYGDPDAAQPTVWQLMQDKQQPSVWDLADEEDAEPPRRKKQKRSVRKRAQKQSKRYEEPKPKKRLRWLKQAVVAVVLLVVLVVGAIAAYLPISTRNDDLWLDLGQVQYRSASILYAQDANGEWVEYARFNSQQEKEYVSSGDIPDALKNAFVAIEDNRFYDHGGVDVKRTGYAILNEIKYRLTGSYIGGGQKQGGSTITQQLIKNLTGDDEASGLTGYLRKIKEMYRARKMEKTYSKDEILTAYLNTISFTGNTAGVQAEARKLFGKPVSELTLAECASLAAITRNPSRFNPHVNPDLHVERRIYVLRLMLEQGYITQEEYDIAKEEPLTLMEQVGINYEEPMTSYFTDTVFRQVVQQLVKQRGITEAQASNLIYNGGLRIYITVDLDLQIQMERIMADNGVFPQPQAQAAMISLDYEGGVAAVVGGIGEKELRLDFDRASMAYRQTGSVMKGIGPYVLGIEKDKIHWSTSLMDSPVKKVEDEESGEKVDWPSNVTRTYTHKEMLVAEAYAQSVNTIAVRVGQEVGVRNIYNFIRRDLGAEKLVRSDVDLGPMVLGSTTYGMTPLEIARAYMMFGNGGYIYTVHSFTHIDNGRGDTLLTFEVEREQVISAETATIMNRMMKGVLSGNGSASGNTPAGSMEAVGKTGTTSDNVDHWFVGLTPYYVTAVWYGYDQPAALYNANRPPVTAWRLLMERGQAGYEHRDFPLSSNVLQISYCTQSGSVAGPNCPSATGYYKRGNEPDQGCPIHG